MQPGPQSSGGRICLFGGTFDPIHSAHLQIAEKAVERFGLDRLLFVPAGTPPHKTSRGITPFEDRLQMAALACHPYPAFEVSRLEEGKGRSYTVDTVRRFRQNVPADTQLFFLIGADAFDEIESWHCWAELIQLIEFIVVTRPGGSYRVPPGAKVQPLDGLQLDVSSSDIRRRLAAGEPTPELPGEVRAWIDRRGLYRSKNKTTV